MIPDSRSFDQRQLWSFTRAIGRWPVWQLPRSARAWLFATEVCALALLVVLPASQHIRPHSIAALGILAALAMGWSELVRHNDRLLAYLTVGGGTPSALPTSVFSFAALIVAPTGWAVALHALLYVQQGVHARLDRTDAPHRLLFSASAALVAQAAAGGILATTGGHIGGSTSVFVTCAAALAYTVADLAIVLTGMWLAMGRPPVRSILPDLDAVGYEGACLALGVAAGVLLLHAPFAAVVLLLPITLLQRGTTVTALHRASRTDAKTGVLNAVAWQRHAQSVLDRCRRHEKPVAVFLVDVDNFGTVNAELGHLGADRALKSIAATLQAEVRGEDAVGRFGGDEFVLVVDDADADGARKIGERIRAAVAEIEADSATISVSIGLAHLDQVDHVKQPHTSIDDLLGTADAALYEAKHSGRNRVCVRA